MANKKYIDFPAGTYDTSKIFLQADAVTGALQKVNLPTIQNLSGTPNRITITASAIDISNAYIGQTSITTLGTITTGTWQADAVAPTYGGTGITSYTTGNILYASATNVLSKLAPGTNGYVLTMVTGMPAWAVASGGGGSPAGSTTQVQYNNNGSFDASSTYTYSPAPPVVTATSTALSLTPTLTAAATGNNLIALNIAPTIVTGGFTGLLAYAIRTNLDLNINLLRIGRGAAGILTNTCFGYQAQNLTTATGASNSAFGSSVLKALTTGNNNNGFGGNALTLLTTASNCCAFGLNALRDTNSSSNCAFGTAASIVQTTATNTCSFGQSALSANLTGDNSCAFGSYSLGTSKGTNNTGYGTYTGYSTNTAIGCCYFGYGAGYYNTANNKLVIHNALTGALLYGDMTTGQLQINSASTPALTASAALEIISITRGMLPPRLTTVQVTAIASPAEALFMYDTTLKKYKFFNGTAYEIITST